MSEWDRLNQAGPTDMLSTQSDAAVPVADEDRPRDPHQQSIMAGLLAGSDVSGAALSRLKGPNSPEAAARLRWELTIANSFHAPTPLVLQILRARTGDPEYFDMAAINATPIYLSRAVETVWNTARANGREGDPIVVASLARDAWNRTDRGTRTLPRFDLQYRGADHLQARRARRAALSSTAAFETWTDYQLSASNDLPELLSTVSKAVTRFTPRVDAVPGVRGGVLIGPVERQSASDFLVEARRLVQAISVRTRLSPAIACSPYAIDAMRLQYDFDRVSIRSATGGVEQFLAATATLVDGFDSFLDVYGDADPASDRAKRLIGSALYPLRFSSSQLGTEFLGRVMKTALASVASQSDGSVVGQLQNNILKWCLDYHETRGGAITQLWRSVDLTLRINNAETPSLHIPARATLEETFRVTEDPRLFDVYTSALPQVGVDAHEAAQPGVRLHSTEILYALGQIVDAWADGVPVKGSRVVEQLKHRIDNWEPLTARRTPGDPDVVTRDAAAALLGLLSSDSLLLEANRLVLHYARHPQRHPLVSARGGVLSDRDMLHVILLPAVAQRCVQNGDVNAVQSLVTSFVQRTWNGMEQYQILKPLLRLSLERVVVASAKVLPPRERIRLAASIGQMAATTDGQNQSRRQLVRALSGEF